MMDTNAKATEDNRLEDKGAYVRALAEAYLLAPEFSEAEQALGVFFREACERYGFDEDAALGRHSYEPLDDEDAAGEDA